MEMEEEKHKFIIPVHERRQPGNVTVDPRQTQDVSPIEAPRIQHVDNSYPQTAHLRDVPDDSPPYPESRRISAERSVSPIARVPVAAAVAPSPASVPDEGGRMTGWMRRLENAGQVEGQPRKTILGLTIFRFWVAVALGVTIVGVAIAVGLALGLANRPEDTPSASSNSTPTAVIQELGVPSAAPINPYCETSSTPKNTTVTPYDASGSPIRFNNDQAMSFDVLCNTFWPQRQGLNPELRDILVMTVPDMLTCMTLCAQYNQGYSDAVGDDVYVGGGICVGVALVKGIGQFCYLKNATGINDTTAAGGFDVDSAVLTGNWANLTSNEQTLAFGGNLPEVVANTTTAT
ncbi:hypothetical protein CGCF415_v001745 [Colletotrichum fructicola]|uniref:Uncharacterized protein n=2 Tax=Colletotrichum gloeosporioides species complex TaxID=2707338 RepID=A0A7J6IPL6_COLFN|nr:uncharacterized protein CGMCC3_g6775 [Colletotrichum fructicola]XP_053036990.1 uncharacterized protein COL26b_006226 [Colletotrichum chrysophilum]KAF4478829.1 hypothetical protein CGGC5_v012416 [Colletotrichum fructicola Nara gc5]KAE9577104.1 hypothetical protein CGMCC3_g6775 [Colletotrichum fructicola]KAF4422492.1 hypothetical protein CFRS1_v000989 [Colletotrichum fructicola]KAF4892039.1 hypothetical protein CGCFRS4_v007842 [Colletotrichum fructicola]KAF4915116.1 hypothetical protein CGCF